MLADDVSVLNVSALSSKTLLALPRRRATVEKRLQPSASATQSVAIEAGHHTLQAGELMRNEITNSSYLLRYKIGDDR